MRDLVRELDELEESRTLAWNPEPGETLVGRVVADEEVPGLYGPCQRVTVEREDGRGRVAIWVSGVVLQDLFAKEAPQIGERIGLRYLGTHATKGYKRFALLVDRGA